MDQSQAERIRGLFHSLCNVAPGVRQAVLDARCPDDPALREHVAALLRHHDDPVGFVETIAHHASLPASRHATARPIDGYRLVRMIGTGAFGTVYEAEQVSPRRRVAIKVLRTDATSDAHRRRFEMETEALARLQHPGIARLYEVGIASDDTGSLPYFAMELIDGVPLLEYCRSQTLNESQKVRTVAEICDAVGFAHERGVVHRDLKPANILVDADGHPHVLDFGIARLTDADLQATTLRTETGNLIGTVPYMSPEQAGGVPTEIDARCDVYALGVILFEMLTGRLPYELDGLLIHEALRVVREEPPTRMRSIAPTVTPDLATIAAKALEKDVTRRYQSPSAMAADLRRVMTHQPIEARPAGVVYRSRKFVRRHRGLVATTATTFALLIATAVGTTAGYLEARAAQHDAEFYAGVLDDALGRIESNGDGHDVLFVQFLRELAALPGDTFAARPLTEARFRHRLGESFMAIGSPHEAEPQLLAAHALCKAELAANEQLRFSVQYSLAVTLKDVRKLDAAQKLTEETIALGESIGVAPEALMRCRNNAAVIELGRGNYARAERRLRDVLDEQLVLLDAMHDDTLSTRQNLGVAQVHQRKNDEAEATFRALIADLESREDIPPALDLLTRMNFGVLLRSEGRNDEAEAVYLPGLEIARSRFAPTHTDAAMFEVNVANLYQHQDRHDDVVALLDPLVERIPLTAATGPILGTAYGIRGLSLEKVDRMDDAIESMTQSRDIYRQMGSDANANKAEGYLDALIEKREGD